MEQSQSDGFLAVALSLVLAATTFGMVTVSVLWDDLKSTRIAVNNQAAATREVAQELRLLRQEGACKGAQ